MARNDIAQPVPNSSIISSARLLIFRRGPFSSGSFDNNYLTVSYLRQLNEDMLSRSVLLKLSSHYSNIDSISVVDLNVQVSSYLFNGSSQ